MKVGLLWTVEGYRNGASGMSRVGVEAFRRLWNAQFVKVSPEEDDTRTTWKSWADKHVEVSNVTAATLVGSSFCGSGGVCGEKVANLQTSWISQNWFLCWMTGQIQWYFIYNIKKYLGQLCQPAFASDTNLAGDLVLGWSGFDSFKTQSDSIFLPFSFFTKLYKKKYILPIFY